MNRKAGGVSWKDFFFGAVVISVAVTLAHIIASLLGWI